MQSISTAIIAEIRDGCIERLADLYADVMTKNPSTRDEAVVALCDSLVTSAAIVFCRHVNASDSVKTIAADHMRMAFSCMTRIVQEAAR